ncbi:caspase family protein [Cucumibacter marinus]|uniref:caspase family protein n=1 Tax=Cucumibacter marinus TaxID=1121252 RepID=UPI000412683A|nr:caspase family protein [Cucumibacter marinus]
MISRKLLTGLGAIALAGGLSVTALPVGAAIAPPNPSGAPVENQQIVISYGAGFGTALDAQPGDATHGPYAAAFADVMSVPELPLSDALIALRARVKALSDGHQAPTAYLELDSNASLGTIAAGGNARALIIANQDYAEVQALENPVGDAQLVANTLKGLGFEVTSLFDLTSAEMLDAIDRFAAGHSDNGAVAFYFVGHGIAMDGRNMLLGTDVDQDVLGPDGVVSLGEAFSRLRSAGNGPQTLMMFLDTDTVPIPALNPALIENAAQERSATR